MEFTRAQTVAVRAILRSRTAVLSARRGARLAVPLAELEALGAVERWRPSAQATARDKAEYEGAWTLTPLGAYHARRRVAERWEYEVGTRSELAGYERKRGGRWVERHRVVRFRKAVESPRWDREPAPDPNHPDAPVDPRGRVLTPPGRAESHHLPNWMDLPDPGPGPVEAAMESEEVVRVPVLDDDGEPARDATTGAALFAALVVLGREVRRSKRKMKGKGA